MAFSEKTIGEVLLFINDNARRRSDGRFVPFHARRLLRAEIANPEEIRLALDYLVKAGMLTSCNWENAKTAFYQIDSITPAGMRLIEKLNHPVKERALSLIRAFLSNPSLLLDAVEHLV